MPNKANTENTSATSREYRFSGHQTFPLRIAWIPKAVAEITAGHDPLTDVDEGITTLGLGKNMVEALRCWIEAFQIASKNGAIWELTPIGKIIFNPTNGYDAYLEDTSTCWILHWLICTNATAPFFAWECLFNRWPSIEFSSTQAIDAFRKETEKNAKSLSEVTIKQHFDVFLHSYRLSRGGKGEDHLDSVLSVLGLIREAGERQGSSGKIETIYQFDTGYKLSISQQLFTYFIHDWWNKSFPNEQTVPLSQLINGNRSPGRIFKMQETEILHRIEDIVHHQPKLFQSDDSTNIRQLRRLQVKDGLDDIGAAYIAPRYV